MQYTFITYPNYGSKIVVWMFKERVVVTGAELRLKQTNKKKKESKQPFTQPLLCKHYKINMNTMEWLHKKDTHFTYRMITLNNMLVQVGGRWH